MMHERALGFTLIAALVSTAVGCNDSATAPPPHRSTARSQYTADVASRIIVRTNSGVTVYPEVHEHFAVTSAGITRTAIPGGSKTSAASLDKLPTPASASNDAMAADIARPHKLRGHFIWGEHRNGADYGLQVADEVGDPLAANRATRRPPRHFILWKDGKVVRLMNFNWVQNGSRWDVSDGVIANIGADGHWTMQKSFAITNRTPISETSGISGTVQHALSRLAEVVVPRDLHAQQTGTGVYDPGQCLLDELSIMGGFLSFEEGGALIDVLYASTNAAMMAVDCGEVIYGDADPNVYTLPPIYVFAPECRPVTMYLDMYDEDGQLMGEDSYEVSSCDLNEE